MRFKSLCLFVFLSIVLTPSMLLAQEMDLTRIDLYGEVSQRSVEVGYRLNRGDAGEVKHPLYASARLDWRSVSGGVALGYVRRVFEQGRYTLKVLGEADVALVLPPDAVVAAGLTVSALNQWRWRGRWSTNLGVELGAQAALATPWQGVGRWGGVGTLVRRVGERHHLGALLKVGKEGDALGSVVWWRAGVLYGVAF